MLVELVTSSELDTAGKMLVNLGPHIRLAGEVYSTIHPNPGALKDAQFMMDTQDLIF